MRIVYEVSVHDLNIEYLGKVVGEFKRYQANYGHYNDKARLKFIKIAPIKRHEDPAKSKVSFKFAKHGNHQKGIEYFIESIDRKSDETTFGVKFDTFVVYTANMLNELHVNRMDKYEVSHISAVLLYKIICELDVQSIFDF